MITTKEFFKQKDLPKWITSHKLFKEVETITKVFPGIGLPNCTKDYAVNNEELITSYAQDIITDIGAVLDRRNRSLKERLKKKISKASVENIGNISHLIDQLCSQIYLEGNRNKRAGKALIVKNANGTITINLPQDICAKNGNKAIFKKGERLFRVYFKLNEMLAKAKLRAMANMEQFGSFKQFSAHNLPPKPLKIVFSSDGADGLWDIATMSMRGISSCQSWGGQYRKCLIGSILDPFVGIIYYTSGKDDTEYGSKMIRRCIVRFAIAEKTKEKYLVLDSMYPSFDNDIADAFIGFLKKQTNDKFKITMAQKPDGYNKFAELYMPLTELRMKLGSEKGRDGQYEGIASYQDHHIKSVKSVGKDPKALLFDKNSTKKVRKFSKFFNKTFVEATSKTEVDTLPKTTQSIWKKVVGKKTEAGGREDAFQWQRSTTIKYIADMIAKEVIASVDKKAFDNSDTYIRRVYYNYFFRKQEILDKVKSKVVKQINGNLGLKKNKINSKEVVILINALTPAMDTALKERLKKLAEKRKAGFSGAAPLPA